MYLHFNRLIRRINTGMGALAGAATIALMFSVVPDLISRSFFGEAMYGMAEAGIMLLVLIVFLALPVAQVRKEHFQVAVLDTLLSPRAARRMWIFRHLVSGGIAGVFAWYATRGAIASTLRLEQSYAVIEFPVWPAKILVAVGMSLLALQFLLDAIDAWRATPEEAVAASAASSHAE